MRKKILLFVVPLVLLLVLVAAPVFAKDTQTNGTPFDEIWTAVRDLEARVTGLEANATPHIGFSASVNDSYLIPVGLDGFESDKPLAFPAVDFDDGSVYDNLTSTFTAPRDGVYHFDFQVYRVPDANTYQQLVINGTVEAHYEVELGVPGSLTLKLKAGDTVGLRALHRGGDLYIPGGFFSGYLVY